MSDVVEHGLAHAEHAAKRFSNPGVIRAAVESDASMIFAFLRRKAAFDRDMGGSDGTLTTSERAIRQTLFGDPPYAWALVAEHVDMVVGLALYYFRYSSFRGRPSLWLDDLYVLEAVRSLGTGEALMAELVMIAKQRRCSHLGWTAAARNARAIAFYERLGARVVERGATQFRFELAV